MSDPKNQEPSMEEILASIRRIIAEDAESAAPQPEVSLPDLPTALVAEPPPPPPPPPVEAFREPEPEEDILELTEIVPDEPEPVVEAPRYQPPEPEPMAWPDPEPLPPRRDFERDRLVSDSTASVSGATMAGLAQQLGRNRRGSDVYLSDRAVTLEEITKDVLKPMLQSWLDENLPGLVERLVREEIQRIARDAL